MSENDIINRDPSKLAPFVRRRLDAALKECAKQGLAVALFEGLRSPSRQEHLWMQGRINKKLKVTNARAWESYHNYGLAVDVAFRPNQIWTWSGPWDKVIPIFKAEGFESLSFEKAHFQITGGLTVKQCYEIYQTSSMLGVWDAADITRR